MDAPESKARGGRVILKMSVQLPDGQKGTIHVFPGSDPRELAEQFCLKHHLEDPKLRRVVERHITENMRALPSSSAAPGGRAGASPLAGNNGSTTTAADGVPYATTDSSAVAGRSAAGDGANGGGASTQLAAAHAKIDKLSRLVEDLTHEVEELTADLIAAKLSQAELANAGLALTHEKRLLEKQLVITDGMEGTDDVPYAPAPAPRPPKGGGKKKRTASPRPTSE